MPIIGETTKQTALSQSWQRLSLKIQFGNTSDVVTKS